MDKPIRKPTRNKDFDYSQSGVYFITICTQNKRKIFSHIPAHQDLENAKCILTVYGIIAEKYILEIEKRYPYIKVETYAIMPNHIHLLIAVSEETDFRASISDIICAYKSLVAKECKSQGENNLWQRSFYDHVIRNEKDYIKIYEYIERNPSNWLYDRYYDDGVYQ